MNESPKIAYRVMSIRQRETNVGKILRTIDEPYSSAVFDDEHLGCISNAINAWKSGIYAGGDYICVIQDDVEIIKNFKEIVPICVRKFPKAAFGFFNLDLDYSDAGNSPYVKMPLCTLKGPAMLLPKSDAIKFVGFYERIAKGTDYNYDDALLRVYCLLSDVEVINTVPSLVRLKTGIKSTFGSAHTQRNTRTWGGDVANKAFFETDSFSIGKRIPINSHFPKGSLIREQIDEKVAKITK